MKRIALIAAASLAATAARADEGMWTFDSFPTEAFRARYGWAPDQAALDRMRLASVRLTGGCSASIVSGQGLILTNHHCVVACLADNSDENHDYVARGVVTSARSEERACPGQQAEVVTAISDVTGPVKAAMGGLAGEAAIKARTAAIAAIESEGCPDRETTRCQVVTLYGGGQYKLYSYRKYSDVRLVWAPEDAAETFGGDPDNYNFPRYALDGAFLRAYENGRPAVTPQHLRWTGRDPREGEVVFVAGNPGSTLRLLTLDEFAYQREVNLPIQLATYSELRGRLISAMADSEERAREGRPLLYTTENNLKRIIGRTKALGDPAFNAMLVENEADLRAKVAGDPAIGDPWATVSTATTELRALDLQRRFSKPSGELMDYAFKLVRAAQERAKPNAERLPDYIESRLPLLEKQMLDANPTYPWLEELHLGWPLSKAREYLGADHPQTKLLLGSESPEVLAERLITGTKLADPEVRKALWNGGLAAIEASDDPLIAYARSIEPNDRRLQSLYDAKVDAPLTAARAKLADARFAAYGDTVYPDATFTLRITFGKVGGWTEDGRAIGYRTDWAGLFDRASGYEPFKVADGILAAKDRIDLSGTMDFVYATDTIGGNSGSPVIDKDGYVLGANFDRNIHGLRNDYAYDIAMGRSIAASTAALEQAMKTIYPAPALLAELYAD